MLHPLNNHNKNNIFIQNHLLRCKEHTARSCDANSLLLVTRRASRRRGSESTLAATTVGATSLASFPLQPAGGIVARHGLPLRASHNLPVPV